MGRWKVFQGGTWSRFTDWLWMWYDFLSGGRKLSRWGKGAIKGRHFFKYAVQHRRFPVAEIPLGLLFWSLFWAFIYLKRGVEETVTRTLFRQPLEKPLFKSRFRGNSGKKGSRRHKSQKRVFFPFSLESVSSSASSIPSGREREREGGIKEYVGNSPSFAIDQKLFHTRCVP